MSILGLLVLLSGCALMGPREINSWHSHRGRAKLVQTVKVQPPARQARRADDRGDLPLRGALTALTAVRSPAVDPWRHRPNTIGIIDTNSELREPGHDFRYSVDSKGTVILPAFHAIPIIDIEESRRALRGSSDLDFPRQSSDRAPLRGSSTSLN